MNNLPQKRLEVFISSAQKPEKDFDWEKLRRRIKNKLATCKYINPFIIENAPSEIPSMDFFSYQVQKSDLIVLILKGELRRGTAAEFAVAKKFKKPFLIYFIKDNEPTIDIIRLQREIAENDYCTYYGCLDPTEDIENKILSDVIENVINFYQYKHYDSAIFSEENKTVSPNATIADAIPDSPNKTFLSYFKSCYNTIYDLIGYQQLKGEVTEEISIFHNFGVRIVRWLIRGQSFYDANELAKLIDKSKEIFSNVDWLSKRWDAIKLHSDGKYEEALKSEEEALAIARNSLMPEWIINDILIDCRNFENDINNKKRTYKLGVHQQELTASSSLIYLPVSDRFLQLTYNEALREEIKINTQSHGTVTFGTNLGSCINHIVNYLFSAVLYGSHTHMILCRQVLSQILYKYGTLLNEEYMVYLSLSLFLLNGSSKEFKQILLKEWDNVYSTITVHADYLWKLTANIKENSRDTAKQVFIEYLGTYLSDAAFTEAESYLYDFSTKVYWGNAENYFDCIKGISPRLNHVKLISAIVPIIEEDRFNLGSGVTKVLFDINLKDTPDETLIRLKNALLEKMERIIKMNGEPQFIAVLVNQRPDIFSSLAELPNNGLKGIQKLYYELNLGKGNWQAVLEAVIKDASFQYEQNKSKSSFKGFVTRPFDIIAKIMDDNYTDEMAEIIKLQFFPLCTKIITEQVALPLKDDCLNSLCSVIPRFINQNIEIPEDLCNAITFCDVSDEKEIPFFNQSSHETVALRLTILQVLLGIIDKNELFPWCFEYSKKDINDRLVLAKGILSLLKKSPEESEEMNLMILSIIFQFAEDEYFGIRLTAIDCLLSILQTNYGNMAEKKLYELALDPTPAVRIHLIQACKKQSPLNKEISDKIIETLSHDANYTIRTYACSKDV